MLLIYAISYVFIMLRLFCVVLLCDDERCALFDADCVYVCLTCCVVVKDVMLLFVYIACLVILVVLLLFRLLLA